MIEKGSPYYRFKRYPRVCMHACLCNKPIVLSIMITALKIPLKPVAEI